MLTQLSGFMAGARPPAELAFLQHTRDDTDQATTYTYAGQNFGAVAGIRRIVAVFSWSVQNAVRTISTVTIGGVAATIHQQTTTGPTVAQTDCGVCIASALVPTGTSGSVVVVANGAMSRSSLALYRAINETGASPTQGFADNTMTANVLSGTVNIPANGWVVAGACANTTAPAYTWVGVTEQYDIVSAEAAGVGYGGGFASALALEANRTVSATVAGTAGRGSSAAMSWG